MKITCVICAGTVQEDYFVAAPCGHTFHHICLDQWLVHQKSCPQCRERCLPRQILRLFLDDSNTSSSLCSQYDGLTSNDLKEKLQEQDHLNKQKEEALRIARQELESVREDLKAWQAQYDGAQFKIDKEKAVNQSLKHQLKLLQSERDILEEKAQEAKTLKEKVNNLERIELLLSGSREDAQEVVANSSSNNLSSYVIALKSEYDSIKERKLTITKEKDRYLQEVTELKRKLRSKESELQTMRANLNTATSDIHSYEIERDNLRKKVQLLEKALESPNSRATLQRILESPMPEALAKKKPRIDKYAEGSSPLLSHESTRQEKENQQFTDMGLSNPDDAPVLIPVQKMSSRNTYSSSLSSGFNGFGGHSKIVVPKTKQQPLQTKRPPLKFAPRLTTNHSTHSSSTVKGKMPIMKLKF